MQLDIIGDIHGHADALEALLRKLGYRAREGAYRHPGGRRAVFIGDLIDRGPQQLRAVAVARSMVEAGTAFAVMGNHEFDAVAYATPDPRRPGEHLRRRSVAHVAAHAAFIGAVGGADTALHRELVGFFATMPLWLDLDGIGIVHACWSRADMAVLSPHVDAHDRLTEAGLLSALTAGTAPHAACEILVKGPEIDLPPGVSYRNGRNELRRTARTRWWDAAATTIRAACVERSIADRLPEDPVPPAVRIPPDETKPVVFGHYCIGEVPHLLAPRRTCLDFCVARGGSLCAYRFDGEPDLDRANLVWVG